MLRFNEFQYNIRQVNPRTQKLISIYLKDIAIDRKFDI